MRPAKKSLFVIVMLVSLGLLTGCVALDWDETLPSTMNTASMTERGQVLHLELKGFEPLQNGFHYENWAITDGQPMALGKFNIGPEGQLVTPAGEPIPNNDFMSSADLRSATAIVITIEPAGDMDALPAQTHFVAGKVLNRMARLTVNAPQALNNRMTLASGRFVLATPTDEDSSNETSGVWFLNLVSGHPLQGLKLPELPEGWKYEGWVVIDGVPVTTGKFRDPSQADEVAPFSGPNPGPPFPGEDFLTHAPSGLSFPTDLSGTKVVLTIEPDPDDSPAPFTLKPLARQIRSPAIDHFPFRMLNQARLFPRGVASIR